jgi:hypothetical protein
LEQNAVRLRSYGNRHVGERSKRIPGQSRF